ncbi:MAG: NUDIX hydrolase [Deltaproteobacteria bacterium]|nr:NUDIX hydrolase [Deltaproteobacteria bacterium]
MSKTDARGAPEVAVGAVVFKDDQVLLVQRDNEPNKGLWAIPGGMVELGETLQKAAEREIGEETGLLITAKEPVHVFEYIKKGDSGEILFHYVIIDLAADFVKGEPIPADDALNAGWFSPTDIADIPITESTRALLEKLRFL